MRNLFAFIWRNHFFFLFLILEVVSVILIVNKTYYHRYVLQHAGSQIAGTVFSSISDFKDYLSLRHTNKLLSLENARLYNQVQQLSAKVRAQSGDTIARNLKGQYEYIPARVLSNSVIHRNNYLMLDKGIRHGVEKDMAVIAADGVVGIVINTSANFSWAMSMLNQHAKINGKLKKNNYQGSVTWDGTNYRYGTLNDLPAHVELEIGDTIVTSGFSLIFPEGIPIGTVDDYFIGKGDHFYTVRVKFSTDFNKLTFVHLVKNYYRPEQLSIMKEL